MNNRKAKLPKKEVSYHLAAQRNNGGRRCGNCVMFHSGSRSCDIVKGDISPGAVCNRWEGRGNG